MTEITDESFKSTINGNSLVLVDFWASWCQPCKMLAPVVQALSDEYKGKVFVCKAEFDECSSTVSELGLRSIPTVVLYKNGKVVKQMVGVQPMDNYRKEIDNMLSFN